MYIPYPIYGYGYGFGFDNFYQGDYAPEPPAPPEPPTPTVIINQNFQTEPVHPQFRDYSNMPLPEPGTVTAPPAPQPGALADDQPTIFLIALPRSHDPSGDRLLGRGRHAELRNRPERLNHVSLSQVDRDFSKQLNADRNVPFALPAR